MATAFDLLQRPVVLLDFETTGLSAAKDRVIEVAAIRIDADGRQELAKILRPDPVPKLEAFSIERSHITQEMVETAEPSVCVFGELSDMLLDYPVIIGHNIAFDLGFLSQELDRHDLPQWYGDFVDTRALATFLGHGRPALNRAKRPYISYKLEDVCQSLGVQLEGAHRALNDIEATEQVLIQMWPAALAEYKPIVNAMVRPSWAQPGEYTPPRAVVYQTA